MLYSGGGSEQEAGAWEVDITGRRMAAGVRSRLCSARYRSALALARGRARARRRPRTGAPANPLCAVPSCQCQASWARAAADWRGGTVEDGLYVHDRTACVWVQVYTPCAGSDSEAYQNARAGIVTASAICLCSPRSSWARPLSRSPPGARHDPIGSTLAIASYRPASPPCPHSHTPAAVPAPARSDDARPFLYRPRPARRARCIITLAVIRSPRRPRPRQDPPCIIRTLPLAATRSDRPRVTALARLAATPLTANRRCRITRT